MGQNLECSSIDNKILCMYFKVKVVKFLLNFAIFKCTKLDWSM